MKDTWRKTTFFSTYTYHHGYFDVIEREFTKCCETELPLGVVWRVLIAAERTTALFAILLFLLWRKIQNSSKAFQCFGHLRRVHLLSSWRGGLQETGKAQVSSYCTSIRKSLQQWVVHQFEFIR